MTKRLRSKFHICKKLNKNYNNIWGLPKGESLRAVKKNNEKKKRNKVSVYGQLLKTKQCLKYFYCNIQERTFKRILKQSIDSPLATLDKFISLLESRLDIVLFRSCLVSSIYQARQIINHGSVTVNGQVVRNPSTRLSQLDVVELKPEAVTKEIILKRVIDSIKNNFNSRFLPYHLEVDYNILSIVFLWDPSYKQTYYPIKTDYESIQRFYR
jgi:small subunit ribosomal protein S4